MRDRAGNNKRWKLKHPDAYLFYRSRTRARRNGLEFTITREWVRSKIEAGRCEVTDLEFVVEMGEPGHSAPLNPSIDRLDCSKGYTPENCRVVCLIYNYACHTWGDTYVRIMAQALLEKEGNT